MSAEVPPGIEAVDPAVAPALEAPVHELPTREGPVHEVPVQEVSA